ncbi:IS66 family insertion sequence element accessory protein TnpB [Bradyrhizobium sp. 197]|nr:IS66 family insertion sequence element accessory protein TnpB [Bradyrhizobium sp. 197]
MILFTGTSFVFRTKRADRLKSLAWDGSSLCCCASGWSIPRSVGRRSATA